MKKLKILFSLFLILCLFFLSIAYGENGQSIKELKEKAREIRNELVKIYNFGGFEYPWLYYNIVYVESQGICVFLEDVRYNEISITEKDLNEFFKSLWYVFGLTRFPETVSITFFLFFFNSIDHYIIVKFPMGAFYDYYRKEKISRADFLKQCEIWIDGEKAVIEGDVIKVLGKEFRMNFTF